MLTIQPPFIRDYFSRVTPQPLPKGIFHRFYLSWEDALWHLLGIYRIKRGATVLVPSFFCGNVIEHVRDHGLEVATYKVDEQLVPSRSDFTQQLKRSKPSVVVIFHAVGIANPLMRDTQQWTSRFKSDCILIEDCVHRMIDPQVISFVTPRHFLIDSLRKVVPIQGANLYSSVPIPPVLFSAKLRTLPYKFGVHAWWMMMQYFLLSAYYSRGLQCHKRYNRLAEWAMVRGYNLIGSTRIPATGNTLMYWLARRVAIKRVESAKTKQAQLYLDGIKPLLASGSIWLPKMKVSEYGNLRGFPLIMNLSVADQFLTHLRDSGILVRFELNDSPWSETQKIIYLPMGLHISDADIAGAIMVLTHPDYPIL